MAPGGGERAEPGGTRIVAPAKRLPGGRALVGGLLVTVATVGAVALSRASSGPELTSVVVAATSIEPGTTLGPENLEVLQLELPHELVPGTFADPVALGGTMARSHLRSGELLQPGDVVASTALQREAAPAREVSLRIEQDRAVDGRLEPGDRIDVIATYGTGIDATTVVVLSDASVLAVTRLEGGISSARSLVLTLALDARAESVALAHALDSAAITLVRTTTARHDSWVGPFRLEAAHTSEAEQR